MEHNYQTNQSGFAFVVDESSPLFTKNHDIKIGINPITFRVMCANHSSKYGHIFRNDKSFMDYFTCPESELPGYLLGCPVTLDETIEDNAFVIDNPKNRNIESHVAIIKDAINDSKKFGVLPNL